MMKSRPLLLLLLGMFAVAADAALAEEVDAVGRVEAMSIEYKPMDVEEAVMQLNLSKDAFLVFTNAHTDRDADAHQHADARAHSHSYADAEPSPYPQRGSDLHREERRYSLQHRLRV